MDLIEKLKAGNRWYVYEGDRAIREMTAQYGQHPYAIVICCSDSRVIPELIFGAELGDLFVIRVAGNVLDNHQLGSIEYAAAHLHCELVVMLGDMGCGAVEAAVTGPGDGFIWYITEDILEAAGEERDPDKACRLNVRHGVERIQREFAQHPEIGEITVKGAVYDTKSGAVEWLDDSGAEGGSRN